MFLPTNDEDDKRMTQFTTKRSNEQFPRVSPTFLGVVGLWWWLAGFSQNKPLFPRDTLGKMGPATGRLMVRREVCDV